MRSIHVLRKPCCEPTVAANVLKHGTGAINVDATRVVCEGGSPSQGRREGKVPLGNYNGWAVLSREGYKDARAGEAIGRWPANLVLQHLAGCVQDGTKKVNAMGATGSRYAGTEGPANINTGGAPLARRAWVSDDGTETVAAWVCAPGCPVAALDEQRLAGGMHFAGAARDKVCVRNPHDASSYMIIGTVNMRRLGDTGGASRFFKQVKP